VAADDAHVFFYDGERLTFGAALWAGGARKDPYATPRPHGLTYTVARSGERIVVTDARRHPLYQDEPWDGAITGLPLRIGEQVVGVMNVAFERPHDFLDSELRVLELLADQAAVALQNARLYEETSSERQRVQLLYDMAQALASRTDPDDIVQQATELTVANLGAHIGEAFLFERGSGRLRVRGLAGKDPALKPEIDARIGARVGRGLVGWIAESRAPTMVSDVRQDPRWLQVTGLDEEIRSALGAPILSGDELLGVMMIFDRARGAFDQRHLDLLVAISRQVGLALSNAEGFQQVRRRLAELTVLQQVAQVVNRRLELKPLLDEVVHQVGEVLGYPVVEILLIEGEEMVRRAGTGSDMAVPLRMSLQAGVVGRSARTNRPSLVPDVAADPDYVGVLPETRSEIVVPLRKGGVVFGVLNVESPHPGSLREDDLRLLSLLADQLSVAIENAALYDHLRQHADDLERTVADRTAALAEALTQAQEADRMKSQFVSDVSHELRTPLSNIRLYLDLIKGGKPGRFGNYLETLNRETGRLVSLIEDLLAISRLEAGSTPLDLAPLDLNKLASGLVEDRQRLFREKGLELRFRPSPDLPAVMADEHALAHAVANLMTNALHYTHRGAVTISTEQRLEDGDTWETLTVADTGLGIAEAEQPHLFTRFFRGAAGRATRVPGTGLGLAICRETIARHGGRITLSSRLGEGSAFTLWLPLEPPA
jgi:signal transduction histidine kinase